ncbi:S-adenosyl-L-methionine-dependent methyltransferase [Fomitiporia mediterranea MF3/22]|uniref:S-adenosyl-L-methionine-dependent methyltransferase n=1 Tax=Fomitiporia mediterranea (strain MF3/22) TaxID=694068 RepID=UPI0004407FA1|nr:S-adenosyl-L-methionine-dependent methyltransferase [Fomitiporia mediterranea MF3/22]EJD00066.1 S-adenosyl-L-methionine-dependent methyltransferase [Fomitiporia mediterranea MF3/22]
MPHKDTSDWHTWEVRSPEERRRARNESLLMLKAQHGYLVATVYDGRLIYDKGVQLSPEGRVLDAGTGTGAWITGLAKEVPESVQLVGTDISPALFPKSFPSNVCFVANSTTNLPASWSSTFDFVHQRAMVGAFTSSDWVAAMSELYRVLKPGGTAQIVDFTEPFPSGDNLQAVEKMTTLFAEVLRSRGFLTNSAEHIPELMRNVGFTDIRVEIRGAPIGNNWGEIARIGTDNLLMGLRSVGKLAIPEGGFALVKTEEDVDALFDSGRKELDEGEGVSYSFVVILARKPLQE